jgi:hypothetical protein
MIRGCEPRSMTIRWLLSQRSRTQFDSDDIPATIYMF